jgi:hypothetical protein
MDGEGERGQGCPTASRIRAENHLPAPPHAPKSVVYAGDKSVVYAGDKSVVYAGGILRFRLECARAALIIVHPAGRNGRRCAKGA